MENYLKELELPSRDSHLEIWGMTDDLYLRALYALVRKEKPKHMVELGTYRGFSTNAMAQGLVDEGLNSSKIYTVDLHEDHQYEAPSQYKGVVEVIKSNTQNKDLPANIVFEEVPTIYYFDERNNPRRQWIDILFVDADHSYENTKADWENWEPYVKSGGLVMFHDIRPLHDHTRGSAQHWNEMCEKYPGQWSMMDSCEMGVIRMP